MAKNRRPNGSDSTTSRPAKPKAGRRMTGDRQSAASAEPGLMQDAASQERSDMHVAQDSHVAQDFGPAQYQSPSPEPSEHEIRLRAYLRYLERGAFDGADFDDWLLAEMELKKR